MDFTKIDLTKMDLSKKIIYAGRRQKMFIGRENELTELREKFSSDFLETILIYGRRRIGKTELIKEAMKDFDGTALYFEARRSLAKDNLSSLDTLVKKTFSINFSFPDFKSLFSYIFELSKTRKILMVIDEFPFIYEEYPEIVSDFRDLIDEYRMSDSNLKFVLSGSYVDVMKSLNDGSSETYGRFSSIVELKAFDYYDTAKFYPSYSLEDKILMYACFGGVAFYNSLIDPNKSGKENLLSLLVRPNSILQLEVEHALLSETHKIPDANSLISLLGEGVSKYSDLYSILSSKKGSRFSPDYLLKKLLDMEIIEKVAPVNDANNKKKTFYRFSDNLMEFYYRYIYKNKAANSILSPSLFYEEMIEEDLRVKYLPKKFESISKEFLIRLNKMGKITPPLYEIGTYSFDDRYGKLDRQFDLVSLDKNGYVAYECKYSDHPIGSSILKEESYQIATSLLDVYKMGFISKRGFKEDVDPTKYRLYSLSDFYNF